MLMEKYNNLLLPGKPASLRLLHTKAEVRYRLYRKRSEADGGDPYDLEEEILEYFEEQDSFLGWENFAILWDVHHRDGKWQAYRRVYTEEEEWNAILRRETTVLPMRRRKANKTTDE